ncbi:ADP-ribosylglycohydrolase family protein [Marinobacter litoralis]|uniref:ADP-ribosylglycohydrolase family protein n=1 Tax=Marinobacter litoralis TaxID=187981 RepID=UPI0018ED9BB9|nr:ADP-ribosylglycohydrolase family protein [Marinobacter litoralis]MBJ6137911.1 ADP-ribosylglycohydrolase family protein [Marinobacter litoralis]
MGSFTAYLLGGAIGDALGGAVEFRSRTAILSRIGPEVIIHYAEAYCGKGKITDDTQMTLFTAEGLLRGQMRGVSRGVSSFDHTVANAYLRWLVTQGQECTEINVDKSGWLFQQDELHCQRAPIRRRC